MQLFCGVFHLAAAGAPSAAVCALDDRRERPEARMPSRGGCVPPGEVPLGLHRFRVLNEGILSRNKAIISFYSHETVIVCVFVQVHRLAGSKRMRCLPPVMQVRPSCLRQSSLTKIVPQVH